MPIDVLDRLREHAEHRAGASAIVALSRNGGTREISWGQLGRCVRGLAGRLEARLEPGDIVLLAAPNVPEYFVSFFGALLAGGVVFSLSPDLTDNELRDVAARTAPAAAIGCPGVLGVLRGIVPMLIPLDDTLTEQADAVPWPARHRAGAGLMLQSSGTTGLPKIVHRTGRSLDAVARNCRRAIDLTLEDQVLAVIPVHHSYGVEHAVLGPISAGATVRLCARFDLGAAEREIAGGGVSILPGVPFMYEMLRTSKCWTEAAPRPRHVYSAGGALPATIYDDYAERHGIRISQFYGASELGTVTFCDPASPDFDLASVGRPLEDVEIRILDTERPILDEPLPAGREGQVAVRAPSMLTGYFGEEEMPSLGRFFLTGDLGRLDKNGNLFLTGRLKLLIDVGGLKVNPLEVEAALCEHPAIAEAVVVPIRISETSSRPKAVIVPRDGFEPEVDVVRRFLRERLSAHKVPRSFEIRSSLPRTPTGKIIRQEVMSNP